MRNTDPATTTSQSWTIRSAQRADHWLMVRRIFREGLDPTALDWRRFVVAEADDGTILGFAQMKDLGAGVQEFGSLVVESDSRGQGIGKALLHFLVEPAVKPVYLLCGNRNISYYRQLGFRELENEEIPVPLRRKWRAGNFFARRFGTRVAAMAIFGHMTR